MFNIILAEIVYSLRLGVNTSWLSCPAFLSIIIESHHVLLAQPPLKTSVLEKGYNATKDKHYKNTDCTIAPVPYLSKQNQEQYNKVTQCA